MSLHPMEFDRVIKRYVGAAESYGDAIKAGDHKEANASHRVIEQMFVELSRLGRGHDVIPLLEDKRLAVRYCAAVSALSIAPERGEPALEAIVSGPPSPIRLMAQVSLSQWRNRGKSA